MNIYGNQEKLMVQLNDNYTMKICHIWTRTVAMLSLEHQRKNACVWL